MNTWNICLGFNRFSFKFTWDGDDEEILYAVACKEEEITLSSYLILFLAGGFSEELLGGGGFLLGGLSAEVLNKLSDGLVLESNFDLFIDFLMSSATNCLSQRKV